jgi:hypothetical protein
MIDASSSRTGQSLRDIPFFYAENERRIGEVEI